MKFNKKNGVIVKPNNLKTKKEELKFNLQNISKKKVGRFNVRQWGIILLGILFVLLIIKGVLYLFDPARKVPNYSIVYRDHDGNLRVASKNGKEITKLAGDVDSVVRYANTTERYILYTKGDNLYLYDKNKGDKTKKIDGDVTNIFGFSSNDRYFYYITKDNDLYIYKDKSKRRDKDVEYIYGASKDYIIYQKGNDVYYAKLNGKKDPERIVDNAKEVVLNKDATIMYYITDNDTLYRYEVGKSRASKVSSDVAKILKISDDYKQLIYSTKEDDIYYAKKDSTKKMTDDISALYYVDANNLEIIYYKEEKLQYKKENKDAITVTDDDQISTAYMYKNELYYTINKDGKYNLYYSKIGSKKASKPKLVLKDIDDTIITGYKKGLVVLSQRDGTLVTLNLVSGGKSKTISKDVVATSITFSHNKKTLYFIGEYESKKREGQLMKSTGGSPKVLLKNVYDYNYIKDKIIYVQTNYSSNSGETDLKVIYKSKVIDIADGIKEMYSVPVVVK